MADVQNVGRNLRGLGQITANHVNTEILYFEEAALGCAVKYEMRIRQKMNR